jgi:aromatic-L-amino-acid/L-tryptophan decarboxylase
MGDTFSTSADEMRRIGYAVVDAVVAHIEGVDAIPALTNAPAGDLLAQLGWGDVPTRPTAIDDGLAVLVDTVLATMQHGDHPRYFARVPGPSSFTGIAADWLATGFNSVATSWGGGAGPSAVELVAVEWLRQLMGLPAGTQGIATSGGSMANLAAVATAHAAQGDGVVYFSDQTHSCVAKALRLMGIPSRLQRIVDTGTDLRLSVDALRAAIETDLAFGDQPSIVVATAGSTNTGAVDDLFEIADLCEQHGLWLHIDGAYGGPARLTADGARVLRGIERADSLVIDPHKWMFQPYDLAVLMVTRRGALDRCFTENPEYLADVTTLVGEDGDGVDGAVDLRNRSPELTRRGRMLKLWLMLRTHGADSVAALVQRGIDTAEYAERALRADPDGRWEVVTPAQLGIVTFARHGCDDAAHQRAAQVVTEGGWAALTCTSLNGRQVLRLCTINPNTTAADIDETLRQLAVASDRPH